MNNMTNMALIAKETIPHFADYHANVLATLSQVPAGYAGRPEMVATIRKSVAIVPITGMIGKEAYHEYYGGTSLDLLAMRMNVLAADPNVSHILLAVNSPGGYVTAVEQTAQLIHTLGTTKPIIACVQGICCSAAYWLASAASKIYTDGETVRVGSIGVYAAFLDFSELLKKEGIAAHEFFTGKYKALGSPLHSPSADEKAKVQEMVDTLFSIFVDNVAAYRDVSKDTVLKSADGQVFFAADAAKRSLTDGQLSLMEVLTMTEAEQKAKADQEAKDKLYADTLARNKQLEQEATDRTTRDATAKQEADTAACKALYTKHLARDPTADEAAVFVAAGEPVRASLTKALEAASAARVAGAKAAGLTEDTADAGEELTKASGEAGLIIKAIGAVYGTDRIRA